MVRMCLDIHEYPMLYVVVDGDCIVIPTDFKGCIISDGKMLPEALNNLQSAFSEWEETAKEKGINIPTPCSVSWAEFKPVLKTILGENLSEISYTANSTLMLHILKKEFEEYLRKEQPLNNVVPFQKIVKNNNLEDFLIRM
ncbi:MAG: type II toxin-antitoxin system HicB family antitoxin [Candidatus Liberibacter psyllaurous]